MRCAQSESSVKTLIAIDGSTEATTALPTASRLLRKKSNEVFVLCVVPEFSGATSGEGSDAGRERVRLAYQRRIVKETEVILDKARGILGAEGIEASTITEFGSPAKTILRLSAQCDVTVVGATSRRDHSKPGIGPVASRVVEHGTGLVLVARELSSDNNWRVLLAVDSSASSGQALRAISRYFNPDSLEVTVMTVVETPWVHFGLARKVFDYPGNVFDKADPEIQMELGMEREAERVVESAEQQLDSYVLGLKSIIREGNPGTEILGEAETGAYDLIVLGAAGNSDFKYRMLGSVSAKITSQAPCSVAVVKFEE
jgi:nucleotide-binding universal stress UspA family protein